MSEAAKRTVLCSNLSRTVTEGRLYALFMQAGPLEGVSIPTHPNGRRRSYGFVTYKHTHSVQYALAQFQGTALYGRQLKLKATNCSRRSTSRPHSGRVSRSHDGGENGDMGESSPCQSTPSQSTMNSGAAVDSRVHVIVEYSPSSSVQPNVESRVESRVEPRVEPHIQPCVQPCIQPSVRINLPPGGQLSIRPSLQSIATVLTREGEVQLVDPTNSSVRDM